MPKRKNRRGDATRQRLLDAAFRVGMKSGASALTIESVAAEARTSKGGLLYHFATKELLLRAMVNDALDRFVENTDRERDADSEPVGRSARAYVKASFKDSSARKPEADSYRWSALLGAFFENPEIADDLLKRAPHWQEIDAQDGVDIVEAMIARLCVDGLFFRELLGVSPVDKKLRSAIEQRLVERTYTVAPTRRAAVRN